MCLLCEVFVCMQETLDIATITSEQPQAFGCRFSTLFLSNLFERKVIIAMAMCNQVSESPLIVAVGL